MANRSGWSTGTVLSTSAVCTPLPATRLPTSTRNTSIALARGEARRFLVAVGKGRGDGQHVADEQGDRLVDDRLVAGDGRQRPVELVETAEEALLDARHLLRLEALAQRLLQERRLGAVALARHALQLVRERPREVEAVALLGHQNRALRKSIDVVVAERRTVIGGHVSLGLGRLLGEQRQVAVPVGVAPWRGCARERAPACAAGPLRPSPAPTRPCAAWDARCS